MVSGGLRKSRRYFTKTNKWLIYVTISSRPCFPVTLFTCCHLPRGSAKRLPGANNCHSSMTAACKATGNTQGSSCYRYEHDVAWGSWDPIKSIQTRPPWRPLRGDTGGYTETPTWGGVSHHVKQRRVLTSSPGSPRGPTGPVMPEDPVSPCEQTQEHSQFVIDGNVQLHLCKTNPTCKTEG